MTRREIRHQILRTLIYMGFSIEKYGIRGLIEEVKALLPIWKVRS